MNHSLICAEGTQAEILVTDHRLLPVIVAAFSLFSDK